MKPRFYFTFSAGLMLWFSAASMGQFQPVQNIAPTTHPADAAPTPSMTKLRQWVAQLGDPDAEIRDSARSSLLDLRREDLPILRQAADAQQPLLPGQLLALRDIVSQIFSASEPYEAAPDGGGMLGLLWQQLGDVRFDTGIVIGDRLPGFCAYRLLRPGDIIVSLPDHPEIDLHSQDNFSSAVARMHAGQTLRAKVLRNGQTLDLTLVLNPHPIQTNPEDVQMWVRDRNDKAEQYWNDKFGSLAQPTAASQAATRQ